MTIIYHDAQTIKNCPQCRQSYLPEKVDGFYVIACKNDPCHGHMAMGDTYEMAVSNWNIYIGSVIREAARDMENQGKKYLEFSFCVYCKEQTGSIPYISVQRYDIECAACHLTKYSRPSRP